MDGGSQTPASRHTALDRWFERALGDAGPQHFGSGWISGLLGLLLSAGSFAALMVFRFPEWLTMADLRALYPVEVMRWLLTLAVVAGFFFSALNILLRPSRRLGLAGLGFASMAVLVGGSGVEVDWQGAAPVNLGLDWLVLNLVLLSLVFVPLERLFPKNP